MSADEDHSAIAAQQRPSRYRSVRKVASEKPDLASTMVQDGGLKRGLSRYRRPPKQLASSDSDAPMMPHDTKVVPNQMPRNEEATIRRVEGPENERHKGVASLDDEARNRGGYRFDLDKRGPLEELQYEFTAQGRRHAQALESAREVGRDETKRIGDGEGMQRLRVVPLSRQISDEEATLLMIQKRKDLERLEKELETASANTPPKSPAEKRFRLFPRSSKDTPSSSGSSRRVSLSASQEYKKEKTAVQAQFIKMGGGGIVPGIDAPKSAVNSGERRVVVRCRESYINLPLISTTTANDILIAATKALPQGFNPAKAILLESYSQLGLERGIRKYEHIRDVMNSWDRDTRNCLIMEPTPSEFPPSNPLSNSAYLEASHVSLDLPTGISVYLYHSQKPGKWNKRHVTLLPTGQIFVSKNADSKPSEKDSNTICHLSDFDIFIPTPTQSRKNLKPPKKFCYAIKSLQRTTFFESTVNYVHFFSTDDENLARRWWSAVQSWRSWYLLYKRATTESEPIVEKEVPRPASKSSKASKDTNDSKRRPNTRSGGEGTATHAKSSLGPLLGTADLFKTGPLGHIRKRSRTINDVSDIRRGDIVVDDDDAPLFPPRKEREQERETKAAAPPKSSGSKYPPVSSAMTKINLHKTISSSSADDERGSSGAEDKTFSSKGLLGRTYTVKQKELKEKERSTHEGPFVAGDNLLGSIGNSAAGSGGWLTRGKSLRRPASAGVGSGSGAVVERPKTSAKLPTGLTLSRANTHRTTNRECGTLLERDGKADKGAPPAPLIDLTPKLLEAKQWSREGKGRGVKVDGGILLVEKAGSREDGDGKKARVAVPPRSYEAKPIGR